MSRRVVITGIGLVTPVGIGVDVAWPALLEGRSGAAPITLFDTKEFVTTFGCEVKDFDPTVWIDKRLAKTLDRFTQFALAAAELARADAGLEFGEDEADQVGVFVGAGLGGVSTLEETHTLLLERGPRRMSPYFVPAIIVNIAPGHISIRYGARGPNLSQVSACSSGAHAIGDAFRCIERGDADVMFAGGTEATITPLGVGGFNAAKALSRRNEEPQRASRPFDAERDGFVIGEGAGLVILELLERAKRRGARIYAEVAGYGLNGDAHHITAPSPEGRGAQRCMSMALRSARLQPSDIGYINAHGTSTRMNDAIETHAIKAVFGDHARRLAVSSTKSMTGHLLGAAGGVETSITALALARGVVPPTINYEHPDPECDLDYVPNQPRELRVDAALSNSFGFGGTNACLILKRYTGD
ncbi:MAG: beta-ketoacyl-ACP synthase II [Proteobacteria bacterium]|nr:beta-ketoacyl-ACP synthase II [Pseudomonadota bacterium]